MGQSLAKLYTHLIFSTKLRMRLIPPDLLPQLHAYIGGTLNALDCPVLAVGGVEDHVHALFMMDKNSSVASVVEQLKRRTSKWVKTQSNEHFAFAWQDGYAVFSVSQSKLDTVRHYIENQAEHHRKVPFMDELKAFLEAYDMTYDERYL